MKHYVVGFMFSENKEDVLLIRKNRPEWQKGRLNGIGGKVEDGEWYHQAIVREFEEETGIHYEKWENSIIIYGIDFTLFVYSCFSDLLYQTQTMTDEELCIFPIIDILNVEQIIPNLRYIIPLCLDDTGLRKPIILDDMQSKE